MNNRISNYTLKYWLYNSNLAQVETLVIPELSSITINDAIHSITKSGEHIPSAGSALRFCCFLLTFRPIFEETSPSLVHKKVI